MINSSHELTSPPSPPGSGLAVRRVGGSTQVQICDLSEPSGIAMLSGQVWLRLLDQIRRDRLRPRRDGEMVEIEITDPTVSERARTIRTTSLAYAEFQRAAIGGRFDGLKPAPFGTGFGPWITAAGVVESDEAKLLDGVS